MTANVSSGTSGSVGGGAAGALMSDSFSCKGVSYRVDLFPGYIELTPAPAAGSSPTSKKSGAGKSARILLRDVAGSSVSSDGCSDSAGSSTRACLSVYAYPRADENGRDPLRRKALTKVLAYDRHSDHELNHKAAVEWQNRINALIRTPELERGLGSLGSVDPETAKPFLVLVNPHAGAGKAQKIFFDHVLPVWAQSDTRYTVVLTKYANFAREYMLTVKLEEYRGILVVSGDGLIYEVLNGLMSRPDWPRAIQTPIGQLPGGSANALACCTAYLTRESYRGLSLANFASSMAFYYARSRPTPIDLVTVQLANKKIVHSFLTVEWAIVADVDLESEKYRFLGNTRFLVGALKRILNLRVYRGRISFLPSDDSAAYKPKNANLVVKPVDQADHSSRLSSYNDNNNNNDYSAYNLELSGATMSVQAGASMTSESGMAADFKYLTPIDKPLPKNWLTVEDNFVYFLISYLPLISPDFLCSPQAQPSDGHMYLTFIRQGISKLQLLKLFKDVETGDYLGNPGVEFVKIKAFRLEPLARIGSKSSSSTDSSSPSSPAADESGIIMVDGERIQPYGPIQGEIREGMGRLLVSNN